MHLLTRRDTRLARRTHVPSHFVERSKKHISNTVYAKKLVSRVFAVLYLIMQPKKSITLMPLIVPAQFVAVIVNLRFKATLHENSLYRAGKISADLPDHSRYRGGVCTLVLGVLRGGSSLHWRQVEIFVQ